MISSGAKTVALIDSLWGGHHPMYFSQFTASFLRAGANVIGLCPEPEAAMKDLLESLGTDQAAEVGRRVHFQKLTAGSRSFFNGRFEGDPVRTFVRWKRASDTLADAEAARGWKCDLVYFPYLDSYLRFLPFSFLPEVLLNRPWSGLYLRNHHHGETPSVSKSLRLLAKGDAILRSHSCRGIGVLDERFIPAMRDFTGKSIVPYPDVTQDGLPDVPFGPAVEIREKARGRKIIGMIGLERRKGLLTILKAAELARQRDLPFFFVCAGTTRISEFTAEEQEMFHALSGRIDAGEIDNLYFNPKAKRIPNESDYNALFQTFDIAWAAYENFQGSSGTISKAALFEIPCVATAGECVGQRVEKYGIGLTIPEGNAERALESISHIAAKGLPASRFDEYREDHSQQRLDRILAKLLEHH